MAYFLNVKEFYLLYHEKYVENVTKLHVTEVRSLP
jgi:hypothetical protein